MSVPALSMGEQDAANRLLAARGRHLDAQRNLERCANAYFGAPSPSTALANAYEDARTRLLVAERELREARIAAAVASARMPRAAEARDERMRV